MDYKTLKNELKQLEKQVVKALKKKIKTSEDVSRFNGIKQALKIDLGDYCELLIVNDKLKINNIYGDQFVMLSCCYVEQLIEILNPLE